MASVAFAPAGRKQMKMKMCRWMRMRMRIYLPVRRRSRYKASNVFGQENLQKSFA